MAVLPRMATIARLSWRHQAQEANTADSSASALLQSEANSIARQPAARDYESIVLPRATSLLVLFVAIPFEPIPCPSVQSVVH